MIWEPDSFVFLQEQRVVFFVAGLGSKTYIGWYVVRFTSVGTKHHRQRHCGVVLSLFATFTP